MHYVRVTCDMILVSYISTAQSYMVSAINFRGHRKKTSTTTNKLSWHGRGAFGCVWIRRFYESLVSNIIWCLSVIIIFKSCVQLCIDLHCEMRGVSRKTVLDTIRKPRAPMVLLCFIIVVVYEMVPKWQGEELFRTILIYSRGVHWTPWICNVFVVHKFELSNIWRKIIIWTIAVYDLTINYMCVSVGVPQKFIQCNLVLDNR